MPERQGADPQARPYSGLRPQAQRRMLNVERRISNAEWQELAASASFIIQRSSFSIPSRARPNMRAKRAEDSTEHSIPTSVDRLGYSLAARSASLRACLSVVEGAGPLVSERRLRFAEPV